MLGLQSVVMRVIVGASLFLAPAFVTAFVGIVVTAAMTSKTSVPVSLRFIRNLLYGHLLLSFYLCMATLPGSHSIQLDYVRRECMHMLYMLWYI